MSRRCCKCIDCIEARNNNLDIDTYVPIEERSKELNFIVLNDHRSKFKGHKAHILAIRHNPIDKENNVCIVRASRSYESYGSTSYDYKKNGKYYSRKYYDENSIEDREEKPIVTYDTFAIFPSLNYVYLYHHVIGYGGLRKLFHNTRRLSGSIPDISIKCSDKKYESFYDYADIFCDKLGLTKERYLESWW